MKRIIITMATAFLSTSLVACEEPIDEETELREADLDLDPEELDAEEIDLDEVPVEDGESIGVACPNDGAWTANYPGFALGWAEYWTTDVSQCNGRKAIRGFCPSSMKKERLRV